MNRGSVLAVDYGRKRIGLAASDPLGIGAHPVGVVTEQGAAALDAIARVCREREIVRIVVGLPLNMDGTEGEMAREVRGFGARLAERIGIAVEWFDERLTSFAAEEQLRGLSKRERRKAPVDAMAAVQILRDWMARG